MNDLPSTFLTDVHRIKTGLIIFRRTDVQHRKWYCRVKVPNEDRYKTISLKTSDIEEAKDKAIDHAANVRARAENHLPIFEKSFEEVAREYSSFLKERSEAGQITPARWRIVDTYIRLHLIPYLGSLQITQIPNDKWDRYALWRKKEGGNLPPKKRTESATNQPEHEPQRRPAKDGTIRSELLTFKAIMNFAASRNYVRESQIPRGDLPSNKARREAFTAKEYRQLHTYAREKWIDKAINESRFWDRTVGYNFILIMTNTGMRPPEAKNLRWRDIDVRTDRQGRSVVVVNVRGKGKFRELVAPSSVAEYFERIRKISKATKPDDFVFTTFEGKPARTLYVWMIENLLEEAGVLYSSSGSRRSTYCFRHTYATLRLMEGVDVYFLAKQMGTSVKMIEDFYGHITPSKNAERILQGMPGWEPDIEASGDKRGSVNAPRAGSKKAAAKKRPGK
jgi:integrase